MKMAVIILLVFISSFCFSETYKWIDEKGTVHFTDDPATIPEKYREKAKGRTTEEDTMSIEDRVREKRLNEDAAKQRIEEDRKAYERSLSEERARTERRRQEIDREEEKIRAEKDEKRRKSSEGTRIEMQPQQTIPPPAPRQEKRVECPDCHGQGYLPCFYCNPGGVSLTKGRIEKTYFGSTGPYKKYVICPQCNGSGEKRCSRCNGVGYVWRK